MEDLRKETKIIGNEGKRNKNIEWKLRNWFYYCFVILLGIWVWQSTVCSDDDTWLWSKNAYTSTICKTPMHVTFKLVSDMLFSGSSYQSRKEMRKSVICVHFWYYVGHAWSSCTAVDSQTLLRELFSPACNGERLGEARSCYGGILSPNNQYNIY
jgi:hypothetical protein